MTTKNKEYFVFLGVDSSIGEPNGQTGLYSTKGNIYKFKNKDDRDRFMLDRSTWYIILVQGGRRVMRKYRQGMSVKVFHEYLDQLGFMYKNVSGDWHAGN